MKKYIYLTIIAVLFVLIVSLNQQCSELEKFKGLYDKELTNVRAYENENAGLKGEIRQYKRSMDDMRMSADSINQKLINEIDKLKIKDKDVQYLQYNTEVIHKTDTIKIKGDTIFQEKLVTNPIDTVIGDQWYNLDLKLRYPSTIVASPTFNSEKYVVIHSKKEYIKPPSKIFFIRWFQRKHRVTTVDIIEKNPYIQSKENRFIEITKD